MTISFNLILLSSLLEGDFLTSNTRDTVLFATYLIKKVNYEWSNITFAWIYHWQEFYYASIITGFIIIILPFVMYIWYKKNIEIVENICLPSWIFGGHIKIEMMESKLLISLLLSGMTVKWRDDLQFSSPTHFSSHFLLKLILLSLFHSLVLHVLKYS